MAKRRITNKTFIITAIVGCFLILGMVVANTVWSSRHTIEATNDAVSAVSSFYLEEMADRRANTITNLIDGNFDQMGKAVEFIAEEDIQSQDDLRTAIGKVESLLSLNRFALVDGDNVVYTQYTTYTGGSRHPFLSGGRMGDRIVSTVSLYGSGKLLSLAIPTPGLTLMGKPFKACLVQIDIKEIVNLMAFNNERTTYFALYSKTGDNLSSTSIGPTISKSNILVKTEEVVPKESWEEMSRNFASGNRGNISFNSGGAAETMYYAPIEGTDWELAVLIRESVISDQFQDIMQNTLEAGRNQIMFTVVAMLLLAAILLVMLRIMAKDKLREEQEAARAFHEKANTDALTGAKSTHAFSERETDINQKIRAHEPQELAVVVCDINGLKHVNDTQGHNAGDKLIVDAYRLICECFSSDAVFRIGGDEFVALLEGEATETLSGAFNELNRKVEANVKSGEVVVAAGYSKLNEEDGELRDVLDRADQIMYERKAELKDMGVWTRA